MYAVMINSRCSGMLGDLSSFEGEWSMNTGFATEGEAITYATSPEILKAMVRQSSPDLEIQIVKLCADIEVETHSTYTAKVTDYRTGELI